MNGAESLVRTLLKGGTFSPASKKEHWVFEDTLNRGTEYGDHFPNVVLWERHIEAEGLTVTLSSFDGAGKSQIGLTPSDDGSGKPSIVIKIANLCSVNPLEWPELIIHEVVRADKDFKWMYRLAEQAGTRLSDLLQPDEQLPIPLQVGATPFSVQGCMGARKKSEYDLSKLSA